jgi:hypothetical protein
MTDHIYVGIALLFLLATSLITRYWHWPGEKEEQAVEQPIRGDAGARSPVRRAQAVSPQPAAQRGIARNGTPHHEVEASNKA